MGQVQPKKYLWLPTSAYQIFTVEYTDILRIKVRLIRFSTLNFDFVHRKSDFVHKKSDFAHKKRNFVTLCTISVIKVQLRNKFCTKLHFLCTKFNFYVRIFGAKHFGAIWCAKSVFLSTKFNFCVRNPIFR